MATFDKYTGERIDDPESGGPPPVLACTLPGYVPHPGRVKIDAKGNVTPLDAPVANEPTDASARKRRAFDLRWRTRRFN